MKKYIFNFIFTSLIFNQILFFDYLSAQEQGTDHSNPQGVPLTINLCSYRNGVGLDQDIDIMTRELSKLGHIVSLVDYRDASPRPVVDINIFIEVVNGELFKYARKNYLLPNPDWYKFSHHEIRMFDKILCKTQDAVNIFKPFNPNTVFMSFTCEDRYDPLIAKDYKLCLHLAGASVQKNTREVAMTWQQNPHFPLLTVIKHLHSWDFPHINNVNLFYHYFSHQEIVNNQNLHGLHICPSGMEGFGHYIVEGLGCGAVVITLDAPPMNEFVKDKRCLVPYSHKRPHYLAQMHYFQPAALAQVMKNIFSLPQEELEEIGRKNREFYLENDRLFKEKLAEIFPSVIKNEG